MNQMSLPEHWKVITLGDTATFTKKPRYLRYSEYDEIPFIPMELIPVAKLSSAEFILKTNNELKSGTYFEPGDILLPKITPSFENGKQCIIKELPTPFGIATTEVIPIREVEGVSDKFYLFYYLLLPDVRTLLAGKMQGTTGRQRLGKDTLVNLQILLPPLPEQRAIAHVLQTIQEAKAARQREIELERERKAALMNFLFSHGTKGEPRKETEIGEIPESWEVVQFKEVAGLRRENVKPEDNQNLNFVGLEHIDSAESILKRWGDASAMRSAKNHFYPDDILYGKLRAYLDKAVIAEMEGICSTDILVFTGNSKAAPRFLVYLLHTEAFVNHAVATSTGISHPRTSWDSLGKFTFPLPPLSEQRAIAVIFQAIDEKTTALEKEAQHLDELFHAMLDELMTGQRSAVPLINTEMDV